MNGLSSNDDAVECPLCMEPLEVDDLTFFPCTCGYQICRFCWHRIRTDENKLCPACRKEYPENPADFKPLSQEEMIAFKSQKRQRDQQRKQKITENRKHLANVRVVQKNLVFVVGLPPRLADADILKKHEYFGKYGKIHKVVINPSTTYAGVQGPSASAYVTYVNNSDALRAIQSVNNIMIDGRLIKTSLGTTKYCSHFMKNQQCPKGDCMYLHELGDPEASFTKEEMHQGKHLEYEKRLHDTLIASLGPNATGIVNGNGASKANVAIPSSSSASSSSSGSGTNGSSASGNAQQKEAWPSLSVSPINGKEAAATATSSSGKSKREKLRNEKRHEKNKAKNKNGSNTNANASNKENYVPETRSSTSTETFAEATADAPASTKAEPPQASSNRTRADRGKDRTTASAKEQKKSKEAAPAPAASKPAERVETSESTIRQKKAEVTESCEDNLPQKRLAGTNVQRSVSSCSENSEGHVSESSLSEKSLTGDYVEEKCNSVNSESQQESVKFQEELEKSNEAIVEAETILPTAESSEDISPAAVAPGNGEVEGCLPVVDPVEPPSLADNGSRVTDALSKLNIFDDTPSFFTSPSFQQAPILKNKLDLEMRQSHLPDLVNDIDGIQKASNTNEWEEAFKNVMMGNTQHMEEQLLQQQHLQQHQNLRHQLVLQQEEFLRMQELQKRNNFATQINGPANDFLRAYELRAQANAIIQQQLLQQHAGENLFGGNMSKFFDFHKSQPQSHHQYLNGHPPQINGNGAVPEPQRVAASLESNRLNSPFVENGLINSQQQQQQQQQQQKQRMMGMYEFMPPNTQSQQNRFTQNSIVDDDLGFDPFVETQKGLAELMENEVVQKQSINNENPLPKLPPQPQVPPHPQLVDNLQRARMPPPGFNHVNTLGLGGASRLQLTSKIIPFMNMPVNGVGNSGAQGQHQMPMGVNWNAPMGMHQNPGQPVGDSQLQHPMAHNKVYNNSDWTSMDPAILSFRQYSSFPQNQIPPHPQQQQDLFLQHLAQQQNSQSGGFNNQAQQMLPMGMPNSLLNGQQTQPPQVNANVQGMLEFLKSRQFV
uniref:CCR4-NOT transcription complex subunit 4 n=1 Tax=Drosophila melanogaster TaxID=7227 RepID=M9MRH8_DROME|nr:CCR4-NOT transcription complex subunit 4, isoform H [Drosophila melanogaster]ADV37026.1 CCR4-NOT transcription complex subunit 4, isoform H [Drosophila melanogaster]|eukprot:NP_001188776.1 CCR4-NOT transcription complex subunit 4, isoform H [Drosophila melanogaster]